jgi:hypothetical protein
MNDEPGSFNSDDWPDANNHRAWVDWRTRMLRSGDPDWQPIANRLAERGLDAHTVLLADLWPEDSAMEEGVLVTADGDVFGFDFSWLHTTRDAGTFTDWRDLTSSWRIDAYPSAAVAAALQILGEQSGRELNAARRTDPDKLRCNVARSTEDLRTVEGHWKSLADSLVKRGINLQTAAWAHIYSAREGRTVSFLVTGDGTAFQFNAQWSPADNWVFTDWKNVTDEPSLDVHERDLIDVALEIARSG